MIITVNSTSADGLQPFGHLVDLPSLSPATFTATHFQYWKQQAILHISGPVEIGYLQVSHHQRIFSQMEKHERTPELLIPLTGDFIIPVCKNVERSPAPQDIRAFHVKQGQAIILNAGCWHWMPSPLGKEVSILVIFRDNTSQDDLIIENISEECIIETEQEF